MRSWPGVAAAPGDTALKAVRPRHPVPERLALDAGTTHPAEPGPECGIGTSLTKMGAVNLTPESGTAWGCWPRCSGRPSRARSWAGGGDLADRIAERVPEGESLPW